MLFIVPYYPARPGDLDYLYYPYRSVALAYSVIQYIQYYHIIISNSAVQYPVQWYWYYIC